MAPDVGIMLTVVLVVASLTTVKSVSKMEQRLATNVNHLSRQLMLQQLFVEERVRSDGSSGLKQCRINRLGTMPYHATTVLDARVAAIHEHANNIRTIGMGEFIAVLNGVEFRTRHNDYRLKQSATQDGSGNIRYGSLKDIDYPDVPPKVAAAGNFTAQAEELRQWFKAWRDQDHSQRDYRKYFPAILCYLEGGWTTTVGGNIDEPFDSDRHFIDADSWYELQEKIRFTSYTGRKDLAENFAYLPTTIMSVLNETSMMAQWNYRIACHKLRDPLPTARLGIIDDITSRIAYGKTLAEHQTTRAARFRVAPNKSGKWSEKLTNYGLLDEMMRQIPGKDGYGNKLQDDGLDGSVAQEFKESGPLKAGYYHRWFKSPKKDAMGVQSQLCGFADGTLFRAKTTQEKIVPISDPRCTGREQEKVCEMKPQRWTYAIPLEIIYLTPLYKWNPYNIEYKGDARSDAAKTVTDGGGDGKTAETAYDGTHSKVFYRTPLDFYTPIKDTGDKADTTKKAVWVKDRTKVARNVVASGTRIHLPEIKDVGRLRIRYPIMPLHYEGSAAWKELTALKELILRPGLYKHMFYDQTKPKPGLEPAITILILANSRTTKVERHTHRVPVSTLDLRKLANGEISQLEVETEEAVGHTHGLILKRRGRGEPVRFKYVMCGTSTRCWDRHPVTLRKADD